MLDALDPFILNSISGILGTSLDVVKKSKRTIVLGFGQKFALVDESID